MASVLQIRSLLRSLISYPRSQTLQRCRDHTIRPMAVAAKPGIQLKTPMEAFPVLKAKAKCKFDERYVLKLHQTGTGKKMKIAVFASGPAAEEAKANGATLVGTDDLVQKIKGGMLDFDRCIATPAAMPLATKVARILGPRGLMPNAKLGTVTDKVGEMIKKLTSGVPFKTDKAGVVHAMVGKVSFTEAQLADNVQALMQSIYAARPRGVKDPYVITAFVSSTMGPSVALLPSSLAGGASGSVNAAAAAAAGAWVYKEPQEPTGDLSKIASWKLRRYMEAKRALEKRPAKAAQ